MLNPTWLKIATITLLLGISNVQAATISVDMVPGGNRQDQLTIYDTPNFSVDILIEDVNDLAGFQFDLGFDGSLLLVDSITSGNFFGTDTWSLISDINSQTISFSETTFATGLDVSSPVVLATINFQAINPGTSGIVLSSVVLTDSLAATITPVTLQNGSVSMAPVPLPSAIFFFLPGIAWLLRSNRFFHPKPKS